MTGNKKQNGFTLIELMLAMAFIAFILLFMVAVILQTTKLYVKGMAIRQINQTGRQVIDEISATLRTKGTPTLIQSNNRLCVGNLSYVWNLEGQGSVNVFSGGDASTQLRLVAVSDPGGALCDNPSSAVPKANSHDLIGPEVGLLKFLVGQNGRLWDINIVLSTSGDNIANEDSSTPSGFTCDPKNQFCAFGDFETSVYVRGGEW